MTQRVLIRDFETRGVLDLKKVGGWRYATHPDTDVLCCAFAVDDGPVKLWVRGDPVPPEWVEAARDPNWLVVAFNDNFERLIEAHIMAPRYAWPVIPLSRHRCLMASALSLALPGKLETVALALNLARLKDNAGHLNMMALSRPRKGGGWIDDPARLARLYSYCRQDVETERALLKRSGVIPPEEQAVWELDAAINDRGIYVDSILAGAAIRLAKIARAEIDAEMAAITGGVVSGVDKVQVLLGWLNDQGRALKNIQKETLEQQLGRDDISPIARRAIELRLDGAHAAANKFKTMLVWRNSDGRVRAR